MLLNGSHASSCVCCHALRKLKEQLGAALAGSTWSVVNATLWVQLQLQKLNSENVWDTLNAPTCAKCSASFDGGAAGTAVFAPHADNAVALERKVRGGGPAQMSLQRRRASRHPFTQIHPSGCCVTAITALLLPGEEAETSRLVYTTEKQRKRLALWKRNAAHASTASFTSHYKASEATT